MNSAFFTEKSRNSGNATPQLADKKGVRVLIATEPEENEKLQVGRLKQISGNDQVQARDLFQSLFYYTPQFGVFFQCNTIPQLSKVDGGVQRRLRVVEFPMDFTENPMLPHQRLADNELKETMVKSLLWKQHFMRMLIHYYQTEVKGQPAIGPPDSVARASKSFLDSCNPVAEWLAANCDLTGNDEDKHSISAVYDHYTATRNMSKPLIVFNHFRSQFSLCGLRTTTPQGRRTYHGLRLQEPEHLHNESPFLEDPDK